MLFNSVLFIGVFLPLTLLAFYGLRRVRYDAALSVLVLASLAFYGFWEWRYLLLFSFSIGFNYGVGQLLRRLNSKPSERPASYALAFGVIINLGLLGYFKYADFFVRTINAAGFEWQVEHVVLPLAISFFTFQQVSYLVDIKRGVRQQARLIEYALFVTFFPQLIAGPIVRLQEVMPQFQLGRFKTKWQRDIAIGISIFGVGLAKKVLLADTAEVYVTKAFRFAELGTGVTFLEAWGAALAFGFQIYFDFSAYSDMAIGLARMFGIRLPLNFASPYKASSIIEFWRTWHMTLSRFLRDYLYLGLGGNRHGVFRRYANLMITMLIGGLWHGAGWNFMVWGAIHGAFLIINHAFRAVLGRGVSLGPILNRCFLIVATILTFVAVTWAWVFFRAGDFEAAMMLTGAMFGVNGFDIPDAGIVAWLVEGSGAWEGSRQVVVLSGLLGIVWLLPNTQQIFRRYGPGLKSDRSNLHRPRHSFWLLVEWRMNAPMAIGSAVLMAVSLVFVLVGRTGEFIYFQF
jgi:alginate O-acetyltransferase complex protein AlgI